MIRIITLVDKLVTSVIDRSDLLATGIIDTQEESVKNSKEWQILKTRFEEFQQKI